MAAALRKYIWCTTSDRAPVNCGGAASERASQRRVTCIFNDNTIHVCPSPQFIITAVCMPAAPAAAAAAAAVRDASQPMYQLVAGLRAMRSPGYCHHPFAEHFTLLQRQTRVAAPSPLVKVHSNAEQILLLITWKHVYTAAALRFTEYKRQMPFLPQQECSCRNSLLIR
jgi:hypothetical protein